MIFLEAYNILLRNVRDLYPHYVEDIDADLPSRMASLLERIVRMRPEQIH